MNPIIDNDFISSLETQLCAQLEDEVAALREAARTIAAMPYSELRVEHSVGFIYRVRDITEAAKKLGDQKHTMVLADLAELGNLLIDRDIAGTFSLRRWWLRVVRPAKLMPLVGQDGRIPNFCRLSSPKRGDLLDRIGITLTPGLVGNARMARIENTFARRVA